MKKLFCTLLVAVTALFGVPVQAQKFNYNYIDAGLRIGSVLSDVDVTGVGAEGSYLIAPNIRLKVGADWLDADDFDTSAQNVAVQAGYFTTIAPNVDAVVDAGLLYLNVDDFDDDTGLKIDGIVRVRVSPELEINAGLTYVDIFDDSDIGVHLAGAFKVQPNLALLVRYDETGETELWSFGVRLNY